MTDITYTINIIHNTVYGVMMNLADSILYKIWDSHETEYEFHKQKQMS